MKKLGKRILLESAVFVLLIVMILKEFESCQTSTIFCDKRIKFGRAANISLEATNASQPLPSIKSTTGIGAKLEHHEQIFEKSILENKLFIENHFESVKVPDDWKKTNMETISALKLMNYFSWTNQSACKVAQYFGGLMVSSASGLISIDGQKAICLDSPVVPNPEQCLVYSFGINNEWSFDDAMELYGCKIFSFDPSMNVSNHNRTENIHFYQIALSDVNQKGWGSSVNIPKLTLSSIYNMLGPLQGDNAIIDYLKIDIETNEWKILPNIIQTGMFDKVRQLSVEVHLDINTSSSVSIYRKQASILQSLENYGMIRFDSKPNIYAMINVTFGENVTLYTTYEMAWYNNRLLRESNY